MVMWKFKSCPRCWGDLFIDRDHYGWYEQCLQCGYGCSIPSTAEAHQHGEKNKRSCSGGVSGVIAKTEAVFERIKCNALGR